jgi:hypothetical protein
MYIEGRKLGQGKYPVWLTARLSSPCTLNRYFGIEIPPEPLLVGRWMRLRDIDNGLRRTVPLKKIEGNEMATDRRKKRSSAMGDPMGGLCRMEKTWIKGH